MTGITAPQWTAIILFVAGTIGVVIRWLWVRFWLRFDSMHDAIHHPEGAMAKLRVELQTTNDRYTKCITREQLDMQIADLGERLLESTGERNQSEQRIMSTLREMHRENQQEIRQLRAEFSDIHRRIDAVIARSR